MKTMQVLKNKKGFTLIEIIVVLIILAILAAAGIPSMIGFIDDARGKAYIAEARVGFIAAQIILTETGGSATSAQMLDGGTTDAGKRFKTLTTGLTGTFSAITKDTDKATGITYTVTPTGGKTYTIVVTPTGTTVTAA